MRLIRPTLFLLASLLSESFCYTIAAQQDTVEAFELRGQVINAATGEPVSGALVQIPSLAAQFSESDGGFAFTSLPAGNFSIEARKPGFFSEQQINQWNLSLHKVPSRENVTVKLTPEGILFGQVKDEDGQPMEAITVKLQHWQVVNGRRQLEAVRNIATDDLGNFRIAELVPGKYYLAFSPAGRGFTISDELKRKTQNAEGYGPQFYPAGTDFASASVLEVRAGAQIHIAQNMARQRLFEVSGFLRGSNAGDQFSITLLTSSGDTPQREVRFNPKTGEFQIPGIPAGSYVLIASGLRAARGEAPADPVQLTAMLPIHVGGDLSGVLLSVGTGISAAVQLRDETSRENPNDLHRVYVRLMPDEFQQFGPGILVPPAPGTPQRPAQFENIWPGTYTVEATPQQPGYIAAMRCGSLDLLREDLTIPPGSAPEPIEITLRNDGARLNFTLADDSGANGVVVYSRDYPRRSILTPVGTGSSQSFGLANLPPGTYHLIAVRDALDLEFRNPEVMEKYLQRAKVVTLLPGDNTTIRVETQQPPEQQ